MELSKKWAKNREHLPKCNYQEQEKEEKNLKRQMDDDESGQKNNPIATPFTIFGEKVRNEFMPEINEQKKKEREKNIFFLEDPNEANKLKQKENPH